MAECSQKFKELLDEFYEEAFSDGQHYVLRSRQASDKEEPILEYVARMEASHRALITLGYGGDVRAKA